MFPPDAAQQSTLSPPGATSTEPRSRSPHPYHRYSIALSGNDAVNHANEAPQGDASESSTERGTEADDEKGPILRALPAAPVRYRKGWKGSKSPLDITPAATPLLYLSGGEDAQSYFGISEKRKRNSKGSAQFTSQQYDEEQYKKYTARRRAEIVRRVTETTLLAAIAVLTCGNLLQTGKLTTWSHQIFCAGRTVLSLYAIYPFASVLRHLRGGHGLLPAIRRGFHIPSKFDPGPLLYPLLIPFCVALSLANLHEHIVHVNLVLAVASVPSDLISQILPRSSLLLHWMFCLIPEIDGLVADKNDFRYQEPQSLLAFSPSFDQETLSLLFPLHQTLLALLQQLTTTSLDPAELQLLSTGLINLLLFASSPQAKILRAIIWAGSLCLFVFCQQPFAWEVTLARIPAWKFVRNKSPKMGLLSKLEGAVYLMLSPQYRRHSAQLDSDDEDYEHLRSARRHVRQNHRRMDRANSVISDLEPSPTQHRIGVVEIETNGLSRSVTLPERGMTPRRTHTASTTPRKGFLALTYAQAQAFKWLFAIYIFTATLSIVLLILRPHIGQSALHGHEPFGWAIGYLFGNIPPLRFFIVSHNLERWISLPRHATHIEVLPSAGWIERYRQTQQGCANMRLFLAAYCLLVLLCGLVAVFRLGAVAEVDTRRKVFHGIMVAMLLPTIPVDPCFIALALVIILSIFLLLDLFRASQVPPISKPLTVFLAPYVDGRDHRGPVIISHIFLLIGCAIPLWLALAGTSRAGEEPWEGWEVASRDLSMISGVVCVGMGDAAASLIGRRYGRTKWFWGGGKSIEGSCAFAAAVTMGLMASYIWLRAGGWVPWDRDAIPQATLKALVAASGASLLESVLTAANDNVVVPIGLWLLVRGLGM